MKYFNVIFWVALFGIIFYFAIDSRDLKRGIENFNKDVITPIDNKVGDIIKGKTPERILSENISYNKVKILEVEGVKQYYCNPNFTFKDLCEKSLSLYTYSGEGEKCDQDFVKEIIENNLIEFGKGRDKNEESCVLLKDNLDALINSLKLEIKESELALNEGRAREYLENEFDSDIFDKEPGEFQLFLEKKFKEKENKLNN